ncbi:hypothetical protein FDZ71_04385, partial [bacterium]
MKKIIPLLMLLPVGCASLKVADAPTRGGEWSGKVRLENSVALKRGENLKIAPGTEVCFAFKDEDGDGLGDISLSLEGGDLAALGTPEKPILFTPCDDHAEPGLWGEIRVDFGKIDLKYTVIEGSTRGLHLHFASGRVEDSVIRENHDGTRIGESAIVFDRCLFADQAGKGFNSRASKNTVTNSLFRANKRGVFLFEGDEGSVFKQNIFTGNEIPFRLGDFYTGKLTVGPNKWNDPIGEYKPEGLDATVEFLSGEAAFAGPKNWPMAGIVWKKETKGFSDAIAANELGLYSLSWEGGVERRSLFTGETLASLPLSDPSDAPPTLVRVNGKSYLAVQSWDRAVRLLDAETLKELSSWREDESLADDHRQSGPVFAGNCNILAVGSWAGRVLGFDIADGNLAKRWEFSTGGAIRGDLGLSEDGETLFAPSEDGSLYALGVRDGFLKWKFAAKAPLISGVAEKGQVVWFADKEKTLYAVSGGKILYEAELGGGAWYARPLLEGGVLYQGDDSGRLAALEAKSGKTLWERRLHGGVRSSPVTVSGVLAVVTAGGGPGPGGTPNRLLFHRIFLGGSPGGTPAAPGGFFF